MKAILEFDLNDPDDKSDHKRAINSTNVHIALSEIGESIFRPARKHGYSDERLVKLIELAGEINGEFPVNVGDEIIGILETMFYEILENRNIDLGEL